MILSADEIHLWYVHDSAIHNSHLLSQYYALLSQEERLQHKRFYFDKDRHQYLITRALLRSVLSLYVNAIPPEKWRFEKNAYGKPAISKSLCSSPLCFNLSHTHNLVVMAVTLEHEIGVDVEYLPRLGKLLELASHFFSAVEVEQLLALPAEQQRDRFFDLWTLKEAYIKACGMGLSIPLDHFSFTFSEQGEIEINFGPERNDHPQYWRFWQIHPNETHKVSMALKGETTHGSYSISMRKMIPFDKIEEVNYPISHGRIKVASH